MLLFFFFQNFVCDNLEIGHFLCHIKALGDMYAQCVVIPIQFEA